MAGQTDVQRWKTPKRYDQDPPVSRTPEGVPEAPLGGWPTLAWFRLGPVWWEGLHSLWGVGYAFFHVYFKPEPPLEGHLWWRRSSDGEEHI